MATADILKTIYNQILTDKSVWQGYVTNAANSLTANIAQSRVDAYCDVLALLSVQISLCGP